MLKQLLYFMTKGLRKWNLFVLNIAVYRKKTIFIKHTKPQILMFGLAKTPHFGCAVLCPTPPRPHPLSPNSYSHILYKIWKRITCIRNSWDLGLSIMFKKIPYPLNHKVMEPICNETFFSAKSASSRVPGCVKLTQLLEIAPLSITMSKNKSVELGVTLYLAGSLVIHVYMRIS